MIVFWRAIITICILLAGACLIAFLGWNYPLPATGIPPDGPGHFIWAVFSGAAEVFFAGAISMILYLGVRAMAMSEWVGSIATRIEARIPRKPVPLDELAQKRTRESPERARRFIS